ncbi:GNAT family N-acetyltransferase [Pseudooceanicola sp. LIPI14-2-Ac024]|uniref:GNAT family N-acetyltransferase n=1 Tax=Pseudooceanicola sp. LIPI14-2-Ac024 TaxID=3344875 RepID=UPI0035CFE5C0
MSGIADFSTPRLRVEELRPRVATPLALDQFALDLAEVLSDEVLAPLPPPLLRSVQDPAAWIAARLDEGEVMAILDAATGTLLGLLLLAILPASNGPMVIHLGYLLRKSAWHRGYASEVVAALIADLRAAGAPVTLLAGVARDNPASARVLQKAGFDRVPDEVHPDTDMFRLVL